MYVIKLVVLIVMIKIIVPHAMKDFWLKNVRLKMNKAQYYVSHVKYLIVDIVEQKKEKLKNNNIKYVPCAMQVMELIMETV